MLNRIACSLIAITVLSLSAITAKAYPIEYPSALSTAPGCTTLTVTYADSGFPDTPFPSGNWMMYQGMADRGYMNITNGELKTASYSYAAGGGDCPVWLLLPPDAEVGQGFYGFFANTQGLRDDMIPGCGPIMLRTAGNVQLPKHLTAYVNCPGGLTLTLKLKHITHYPGNPLATPPIPAIPIEWRWQAQWHSDVLPEVWGGPPADAKFVLKSKPRYVLDTIKTVRGGKTYSTPTIRLAN